MKNTRTIPIFSENFLFSTPELYASFEKDFIDETIACVRKVCGQYLGRPLSSILDVGCGTGRLVHEIGSTCVRATGIELSREMVRYAQETFPNQQFMEGDVRSLHLHATYDVVACMGMVLMYVLRPEEIRNAIRNMVEHMHEGSILILDMKNPYQYLTWKEFTEPTTQQALFGDRSGKVDTTLAYDRQTQTVFRTEHWYDIPGYPEVTNENRLHLFYPSELVQLVEMAGLKVAGVFDRFSLEVGSEFDDVRLILIAKKGG